jgi:transposase
MLPYSGFVETTQGSARLKEVVLDRSQMELRVFDLDSLIEENHPARMIWELAGRFDLSQFETEVKTVEGAVGRPCWPARLLVSIWVYSYTLGTPAARAIARMLAHEPGLRWLAADQQINYHTLADFKVGHEKALQELFAQFLAVLQTAGVVDLKTLLHDGTKMRAVAGRGSLHRRETLQHRVKEARRVVRMLDKRAEEAEAVDQRRRAAQERAAREKLSRAEAALKRLQELEEAVAPSERDALTVSISEPEVRRMKHSDGGVSPSYNMQVTTEAKSRMIVAIGVTTATNDVGELMPALERVKENCGVTPETVIADGGYVTRENVQQTSEQNIELVAPWKDDAARSAGACKRNGISAEFAPAEFHRERGGKKLTCPAGQTLVWIGQKKHHGVVRDIFEAAAADCQRCQHRKACCGTRGGPRRVERVVESKEMKAFAKRMKEPAQKELYKRRSEVAEFPHMWMKAVKKLRRFTVRGLVKTGMEALWMALSYNIDQWLRLRPALAA